MTEYRIPFTKEQEQRLNSLCAIIHKRESEFIEVALAVRDLKVSNLWHAKADSWMEFVSMEFPQSYRQIREWVQAAEVIKDYEQRGLPAPKSIRQAVKLSRQSQTKCGGTAATSKENLSVENTSLTKHTEKSPVKRQPVTIDVTVEKVENLPPLPVDWRSLITNLWRHIEHLSKRQDLTLEAMREVCTIASEARKLQTLAQTVLPGMESLAGGKKPFRAPSIEEVKIYCQKCSISEGDAEGFWNKMEAQGWKVNGKQTQSWMRLILWWRQCGYLASQQQQKGQNYGRNNGSGSDERSLIAKEVDRTSAAIQREFGNPRRLSDC